MPAPDQLRLRRFAPALCPVISHNPPFTPARSLIIVLLSGFVAAKLLRMKESPVLQRATLRVATHLSAARGSALPQSSWSIS